MNAYSATFLKLLSKKFLAPIRKGSYFFTMTYVEEKIQSSQWWVNIQQTVFDHIDPLVDFTYFKQKMTKYNLFASVYHVFFNFLYIFIAYSDNEYIRKHTYLLKWSRL